MRHVIFASYGNDSIALIQWAHENNLRDCTVVYSDTGWAAPEWPARVKKAERWVRSLGMRTARTGSEGMLALTERKKAWPRGGGGKYQFCTAALKQEPALAWLEKNDPDQDAVVLVGIRAEESRNRATHPIRIPDSAEHGGRDAYYPLVHMLEQERNGYIKRTPFEVLPHKSRECYPCVNARQAQIAALPVERIAVIHSQEQKLGVNSEGNPRVMFSPKRCGGATGIHEVVLWAKAKHPDTHTEGCGSGWCGG